MSEEVTRIIIQFITYLVTALGFAFLVDRAVRRLWKQIKHMTEDVVEYRFKQVVSLVELFEERVEHLEERTLRAIEDLKSELLKDSFDRLNNTIDSLADLEEKIVMIHQDILYMDSDLTDAEERIMRLEYRPGKPETQTIEAQAVQAPSMIRRRRQFNRMRRQ